MFVSQIRCTPSASEPDAPAAFAAYAPGRAHAQDGNGLAEDKRELQAEAMTGDVRSEEWPE